MNHSRALFPILFGLAALAGFGAAEAPALKGAKSFQPYDGLTYGTPPKVVPTGCPAFEIDLPRAKPGVVKASDFGFATNSLHNAGAVTRAIAHAKAIGAGTVELAPGVYRCHDAEGVRIFGAKDLEIDGKGAVLVFYRPSVFREVTYWEIEISTDYGSLRIFDCERVRIKNLFVDWDWEVDPLAERIRVAQRHLGDGKTAPSYVDVDFVDYTRHPTYPRPLPIQTLADLDESTSPVRFAQTGACRYFSTQEGSYGMKTEWLAPNRARLYPYVAPTDPAARVHSDYLRAVTNANHLANNLMQVKALQDGRLYRLCHYYVGKNCFDMRSNAHLTLENVTVHSCRGDAFHVEGKQHHWQYVNVHVAPPADPALAGGGPKTRPMTTTLDVMHVGRSCGYAKLIGFTCTLNQDDHANFHDRFSAVRRTGAREVKITQGRQNAYFQAEAGTTLEFRNPDLSPSGFSAKIIDVVNDDYLLLDREVPARFAQQDAFVFDSSYGTENVLVKDSVYHSCWGRFLTLAKNVTFENCTWKDCIAGAVMVQQGLNLGYWAEGFGCANIVVRDCTFEANQRFNRAGFAGVVQDIFIGGNLMDHYKEMPNPLWPGIISGVLVEKCRFVNPRGACWHASKGENLIFRDNEIVVDRPDANMLPYRGSVVVEAEAKDVYISGNRYRSANDCPAGLLLR
ncbi:MAG: right-handed parallel beta-helix repeat-containing protein [Kiritimatiellae bacterium]|nr:right-handed parallel beta-helix repeat-containing protein [Kiritimatiellia bacterium]